MTEFQKAYTYNPDSIALNLLIGKMFEKKDDFKSASREYHKAFQKELSAVLKVTCGKCGYQISKWVGRCPKCKDWDIKGFDINKTGQKLLS
jgi:lipopolysaccharide biosynthesis regulator YciM